MAELWSADHIRLREHWCHTVSETLQGLIGELLEAERESFSDAITRCASTLPEPISTFEQQWMRVNLTAFCGRCGPRFHAGRHSVGGMRSCPFAGQEFLWPAGVEHRGPRLALLAWLASYLRRFDRTHPHEALPCRVAKVLRARPERELTLSQVARRFGTSRGPLVRSFTARYGVTPSEYRSRVRILATVRALMATEKVEYAARCGGYRGEGSFYATFEQATGFRPAQIRGLTRLEAEGLIAARLEVNPVVLRRKVTTEET